MNIFKTYLFIIYILGIGTTKNSKAYMAHGFLARGQQRTSNARIGKMLLCPDQPMEIKGNCLLLHHVNNSLALCLSSEVDHLLPLVIMTYKHILALLHLIFLSLDFRSFLQQKLDLICLYMSYSNYQNVLQITPQDILKNVMGFLLGQKSDQEQVEGSILFYLIFSFFKMKTLKFYSLSKCQLRNTTLATMITLFIFNLQTLFVFSQNPAPFYQPLSISPTLQLLANTVLLFLWAQRCF